MAGNMSINDGQQVGEKKQEPTLIIHPFFNPKKPGDVILRADDGIGFDASLSLLAELSSFFRNLPKDLNAEEHEGTTVIPLEGANSTGLKFFVRAVASLLHVERYCIGLEGEMIIEAAVCAKIYDVPVLFRILIDGVTDDWTKFAVAAIGDLETDMLTIAKRLVHFDLLSIPHTTIQLMKRHTDRNWERFKDLIMRHHLASCRFRDELRVYADRIAKSKPDQCDHCDASDGEDQCALLRNVKGRSAVASLWEDIGIEGCACWVGGLHDIVKRYLVFSEPTLREVPWL